MTAIFDAGAGYSDALRMARGFQRQSVWTDAKLDDGAVTAFLENLAASPSSLLIVTPHGMVGGLVMPLWFAPTTMLGVELFWYSELAGEGQALRSRFEAWARREGAETVQFSCMLTEREPALRRLYKRAGFEPIEIGFRKVV